MSLVESRRRTGGPFAGGKIVLAAAVVEPEAATFPVAASREGFRMADVLCSEQFGSGAARGCRAAPDAEPAAGLGAQLVGVLRAFTAKPGGRDGAEGWLRTAPTSPGPAAVFLPQGFSIALSPDYLPHQLWDSVQVSLADWGKGRDA